MRDRKKSLAQAEKNRMQRAQKLATCTQLLSAPKIFLLLEMWDSEMLNVEICAYLNISSAELRQLARRFNLGSRRTFCRNNTPICCPVEKEKRAAEVRKKWSSAERFRRLGHNMPARWVPPAAYTSFQYHADTNTLASFSPPRQGNVK